ncbi:uncharacterized protein LOC112269484 [Brachypodium distachyon]|uniref:Uncharacterized protein n=1 Tax=Brachypodium distachyon TaxID=15368 RepID=A0A0Q3KVH2_BRADI|nr:uncharacterized protein LOC112269484 [Brachypodium distachyon]KQJ84173.1 hypothetical protein BRADI_5g19142v3 [Brachypodium distachyon]|eukprot:XP_024312049.1 uncharacterized protein LOC112269484 [Brachypodium distachyon]
MRGSVRSLVETAARQIKPVNGRLMTVSTPQKHEKEVISSESVPAKDENMEPLVAFSRPPPMPPVIGPLIALSLFQTSSSDEDNK